MDHVVNGMGFVVGLAVPDTVEQQAAVLLKLVRGLTETTTTALQSRSSIRPAPKSGKAVHKELEPLERESAYETGLVSPQEAVVQREAQLQVHMRADEDAIQHLNERLHQRTQQLKVLHEYATKPLPNFNIVMKFLITFLASSK